MHIAYIVNVTSICVYRDNDGAIFHTIYEICYSEHGDTTSPLRLACSVKFKSMTVRCNLVKRTQGSGYLGVADALERVSAPIGTNTYTYVQST